MNVSLIRSAALILLAVIAVTSTALTGCKQGPSTSEPNASTKPNDSTQHVAPKHIVDGCPTHQNMKELLAQGRPLVAEADALLLAPESDIAIQQTLQGKLKSWSEEIQFAKNNSGLLLSSEGTSTFPELTLAIDDLLAASGTYLRAFEMPPEKSHQRQLCAKAGRAAFDTASKLVDGTVAPRSSKVLNFLGDKKYRDIIRIERTK
jgi:hypothetical protein